MGKALYRKYRSKNLSEVIGQEHITKTLDRAIKSGRISHAYLFTGPRGVGKTSIARILAHEINELPYTDDTTHIDIIEIDAASNRRIDEIRELRDKVYVAPTSARFKVYIIDEVHMLTKEAFNALLKTLEEPPAHVVFILATTDVHKLPDTIISRTQHYSFRPIDREQVIGHLKTIAKQEKINIDDDALALLADHGEGSFRDSISLLDQAGNNGQRITLTDVQTLLGIPPETAISTLLNAIMHDVAPHEIVTQLNDLENQGFQASSIAMQLAKQLRNDLLATKPSFDPSRVLTLLAQLIEVPAAYDPDRFLEITLLRALARPFSEPASVPAQTQAVKTPQNKEPEAPPLKPKKEATIATPPEPVPAEQPSPEPAARITPDGNDDFTTLWPKVLDALKSKYNTLYGVVRMAHPTVTDDGTVELAFAFPFHQKRVNEAKNQKIISDTIEQVSGTHPQIHCIVDKSLANQPNPVPKTTTPPPQSDSHSQKSDALSAINDIFGGGEMLQS